MSKAKATKSTPKAVDAKEEFSVDDFHHKVDGLIKQLIDYTLRGTSLEAAIPDDQDVVERLYEQVRDGYTTLSLLDDLIGVRVDELGRFMNKLTESRHKNNVHAEVEPEPQPEENVVNENSDDEEECEEAVEQEEASEEPQPKKKSKGTKAVETVEVEREPETKSSKKDKKKKAKEDVVEPEPVPEPEPEPESKSSKKDKKKKV